MIGFMGHPSQDVDHRLRSLHSCGPKGTLYQLMADGSTLKTAMKTIKEDQLFWTREVYERVLFQQLKTPRDPKGKGKGKDKGKKGGKTKGVYQDHLKNNPGKGSGKNDKASKGGRPNGWPQNWAMQGTQWGPILPGLPS